MRRLTTVLAFLTVVLLGIWGYLDHSNAAIRDRMLQEAPFQRYRELYQPNLRFGEIAPDFTLYDENHRAYSLQEIAGKERLTLITGIRSDSAESRQHLVELREAMPRWKDRKFAAFCLTGISPSAIRELKRRYRPPFPVLEDPCEKILHRLGMTTAPYSLLIDSNRRVIFSATGMRRRGARNKVADKIDLELTGLDPEESPERVNGSETSSRFLYLNTLEGEPVKYPFSRTTLIQVLSSGCPDCPKSYERFVRTLNASSSSYPVAVIFEGDPYQAKNTWLTEENLKELKKAIFLTDLSGEIRKRVGLRYYGGAALVDASGRTLLKAEYQEGPDYEKVLRELLEVKAARR